MNDILEELSRFNNDFTPTIGQKPGLDSLPDGVYVFEITSAELTRTAKTGEAILRLDLMVAEGPCVGTPLEVPYFFRSQQAVNRLGGDLLMMGYDTQNWRGDRPFNAELAKVVEGMSGKCFKAMKRAEVGNDGKTYQRLNIVHACDRRPPAAAGKVSRPAASPPPRQAQQSTRREEEVPF